MSVPLIHETDAEELDLPGRHLRWLVSEDRIPAKHCSACVIRVAPGEKVRPAHSHPNGDEIVHVIDGVTTLHLITSEGRQSLTLSAGMMVVVPQNAWHQFESPGGVCVMTATPQPSEHIKVDVDDPRT